MSQTIPLHSWPDSVDLAALAVFVLAVAGLPLLGYVLIVLDVRAYLRSLRRQLVRTFRPAPEVPEWLREETPRCLAALGLALPCSEHELLEAYREKVKLLHPDRGGDRRRFLKLQAYFEESLAYLRTHQPRNERVVTPSSTSEDRPAPS